MTQEKDLSKDEKVIQTLEEICENTRAIRRVVNRILDKLHEESEGADDNDNYDYDPDTIDWKDLYNSNDMYY
jgi:hypothetical protein